MNKAYLKRAMLPLGIVTLLEAMGVCFGVAVSLATMLAARKASERITETGWLV